MSDLDRYLADPVALIEDLRLDETTRFGDVMADFQRELFEATFAAKPDGRPLHRLLYSERERGGSKTSDAAAILLADLLTGPIGHRSYCVAGDQDQAALLTESVKTYVVHTPNIAAGIDVQKLVVRNDHTGSEVRVLSADAPTAYGLRAHRIVFDELTAQRSGDLWTAMWSTIAKNKQSQMLALTMAGYSTSQVAWGVRELARESGAYFFQSGADRDPAPWIGAEEIEEMRRTLHPLDFERLFLCRWVEPSGAWISRELYEAAETGHEVPVGDPSHEYVIFCDVGLVHDPTVIAVGHLEEGRVIADTIRTFQGSHSDPVDLQAVEDATVDLCRRFRVVRVVFESPQAAATVQNLQRRLRRVDVEMRHPTAEVQANTWGAMHRAFSTHTLVIPKHEQLKRECLALVVKTVGGRIRAVDSGSIHQDHAISVAALCDILFDGSDAGDAAAIYGVIRCECGFAFKWAARRPCPGCGAAASTESPFPEQDAGEDTEALGGPEPPSEAAQSRQPAPDPLLDPLFRAPFWQHLAARFPTRRR